MFIALGGDGGMMEMVGHTLCHLFSEIGISRGKSVCPFPLQDDSKIARKIVLCHWLPTE
jgi:uncharacterized protein YbcI